MGPLVLDEVVQKCLVDVSEEGTEAAATTAAVIAMTSARPAPVVEMNVNRPFFFLIVDPSSEIILFAGRITAL
jgi:serpin B